MNILALDLGTKTGWALLEGGAVTSGTWLLATPKELKQQKAAGLDRCCDMRPVRLLLKIQPLLACLDVIAFEDVQFLSTQLQAQLWSSLRAMVTLQYPARKLLAVPVGTLKKFATGFGNAKKEDMAAALAEFKPGMDDNEVDARHLLNFARKKYNV